MNLTRDQRIWQQAFAAALEAAAATFGERAKAVRAALMERQYDMPSPSDIADKVGPIDVRDTELQMFLAMLDRSGVPHQESRAWDHQKNAPGDGTEVDLEPRVDDQDKPGNCLTGATWASATFTFGASGALLRIHMEGD